MLRDSRRPLSVTIISILYLLTGAAGFAYHLADFKPHQFFWGPLAIELVSLLAIVAGIFMLRGDNWARWLALVWMTFHVAISFLNGWRPVVIHTVFLGVIVFFLLSRRAAQYFGEARPA